MDRQRLRVQLKRHALRATTVQLVQVLQSFVLLDFTLVRQLQLFAQLVAQASVLLQEARCLHQTRVPRATIARPQHWQIRCRVCVLSVITARQAQPPPSHVLRVTTAHRQV